MFIFSVQEAPGGGGPCALLPDPSSLLSKPEVGLPSPLT